MHLFLFLAIILHLIFISSNAFATNVILITMDGVRHQEIFEGSDPKYFEKISPTVLFPNINNHFVENGIVIGHDFKVIASGPSYYSVPGYLEILRGHPTKECFFNNCSFRSEKSIFDLFQPQEVGVFSSWDKIGFISEHLSKNIVINSGRFRRSQNWKKTGLPNNSEPLLDFIPSYRKDLSTEQFAIEYLVAYKPKFLWISLGDSDEWAHRAEYNEYLHSLIRNDKFIGNLFSILATLPEYKDNFVVIVTTDHGRGKGDEWSNHGWVSDAKYVWLMIAGKNIPHQGYVSLNQSISLSFIYPLIQDIMSENQTNLLSKIEGPHNR